MAGIEVRDGAEDVLAQIVVVMRRERLQLEGLRDLGNHEAAMAEVYELAERFVKRARDVYPDGFLAGYSLVGHRQELSLVEMVVQRGDERRGISYVYPVLVDPNEKDEMYLESERKVVAANGAVYRMYWQNNVLRIRAMSYPDDGEWRRYELVRGSGRREDFAVHDFHYGDAPYLSLENEVGERNVKIWERRVSKNLRDGRGNVGRWGYLLPNMLATFQNAEMTKDGRPMI